MNSRDVPPTRGGFTLRHSSRCYARLLSALISIVVPVTLFAQTVNPPLPIKFEELLFLRRAGFSEAEILASVKERKLRAPLNSSEMKSLKQNGATDAFIAGLKHPDYNLPSDTVAKLDNDEEKQAAYMRELRERLSLLIAARSKADDEVTLTRQRLGIEELERLVLNQQQIIELQQSRLSRLEALLHALTK